MCYALFLPCFYYSSITLTDCWFIKAQNRFDRLQQIRCNEMIDEFRKIVRFAFAFCISLLKMNTP